MKHMDGATGGDGRVGLLSVGHIILSAHLHMFQVFYPKMWTIKSCLWSIIYKWFSWEWISEMNSYFIKHDIDGGIAMINPRMQSKYLSNLLMDWF